jgi:predicted NBD/HSP70 family sugar kinase
MRRAVGVAISERVTAGLVEGNAIVGGLRAFPREGCSADDMLSMPAERIAACIGEQAAAAADSSEIAAVGVGFPGIIRNGVLEESPNLQQVKGSNMQVLIATDLRARGIQAPVHVFNDADLVAAGLAATRGHLDRLVRVWTLGIGIGYGQYPWSEGAWEGGHMVVSLDPKERFCGCGGQGHMEGIMGYRAMRLRFLDLEPEEVFEQAQQGDARCSEFVSLWHRALAAATASMIHLGGPGKFFITGVNAKHVDLALLNQNLNGMVKMSPLQGYVFEIVPGGDEIAIIGAAVNASLATAA